jgi:hypothetical protein
MSAFKKIAGLVAGASAVGVIGVAVAQGVPPNPHITNPALGAGTQTVLGTPIGETGVLAESEVVVQQTAVITPQAEQATVASQPAQDTQPVASAPSSDTSVQPVAQAPRPPDTSANHTQAMGAGPSEDTSAPKAPRSDRG